MSSPYRATHGGVVVTAALRGEFRSEPTAYVLDGPRLRLAYPRTKNSIARADGTVEKGGLLVTYPNVDGTTLLFLLRNAASSVEGGQFESNQLGIYSEAEQPVYSISAGTIIINAPPMGGPEIVVVAENGDAPLWFYEGYLSDVVVETGQAVDIGTRIGRMTRVTTSCYAGLYVETEQGQLSPLVVYVEVKE